MTSILDPHPPSAPSQDIVLPQEGEIVRCTVQSVKKYGIFLDLHENVKTLLHVKDMNRGYVADAGQYYRVGQEVPVQVVGIDWERQPPEVRVQVVTPEMEY
ncbi:MAG TPA: S1 RNA-binding domain-containing protein [Candidatus Krumholzibacteria bacterium]|nr:S1 RNA-binding domain-containing protein [Candidatus Krumholzibacteria bacterium]